MTEEVFELITALTGIYKSIVLLYLFFRFWQIAIEKDITKRFLLFFTAITLYVMILEFIEMPQYIKYPPSMIISVFYCCYYKIVKWEVPVFLLTFLFNLHTMSFLIASCISQILSDILETPFDLKKEEYIERIYYQIAVIQIVLIVVYSIILTILFYIFRKCYFEVIQITFYEFLFLSVLNAAAIILTYMVLDLSIIKLETDVFILFDERKDLLYKLPIMAILLLIGEYSSIYVWGKHRCFLQERQMVLAREEQLKQMKRRFEEAEMLYHDIRKLRHEMKNHMTNIQGLIVSKQYGAIKGYVEKLDQTIDTIDLRFSTGNAICDVIINDKYRQAEKCHIFMDVNFHYVRGISDFDMGIILSNLLDNAIEACKSLPQVDQWIELALEEKGPCILIEVKNPCGEKLLFDEKEELPITTKKAQKDLGETLEVHGIGLKNVKEIAEYYMGGLQIEVTDHIFHVIVMLQKPLLDT